MCTCTYFDVVIINRINRNNENEILNYMGEKVFWITLANELQP
jgi:hypothetical protein